MLHNRLSNTNSKLPASAAKPGGGSSQQDHYQKQPSMASATPQKVAFIGVNGGQKQFITPAKGNFAAGPQCLTAGPPQGHKVSSLHVKAEKSMSPNTIMMNVNLNSPKQILIPKKVLLAGSYNNNQT